MPITRPQVDRQRAGASAAHRVNLHRLGRLLDLIGEASAEQLAGDDHAFCLASNNIANAADLVSADLLRSDAVANPCDADPAEPTASPAAPRDAVAAIDAVLQDAG